MSGTTATVVRSTLFAVETTVSEDRHLRFLDVHVPHHHPCQGSIVESIHHELFEHMFFPFSCTCWTWRAQRTWKASKVTV